MEFFLLGIVGFPLVFWLPGLVTYQALFRPAEKKWQPDFGERLMVQILISVLLSGWFGFVLAELALFSIGALLGSSVAYCLILFFFFRGGAGVGRRGMQAFLSRRQERGPLWKDWRALAFLGTLALGAVLFFQPAEMIRGALDAGVYMNTGVHIARAGSVLVHDRLLADLPQNAYRELMLGVDLYRFKVSFLRMAGFYAVDPGQGLVVPQLYHLFPVWIAVFYSLVGLRGAMYATPVLALISSATVFFAARRLFGRSVALVAFFLLVIGGVQIWFARYSVSEMLTQLLVFAFFYFFYLFQAGLRNGDRRMAAVFGVLAGAALGQTALVRADFVFLMAPIPFYLLYLWLTRSWRREHLYFFVPFGLLLIHALIHIVFFTRVYTTGLYFHILRATQYQWRYEVVLMVLVAAVLFALDRSHKRWRPILGWGEAHRQWIVASLMGIVLIYVFYAYIYRPHIISLASIREIALNPALLTGYIGAPVTRGAAGTLVRFGWYLSPLGILLATVGILAVLRRGFSKTTILFLSVVVVCTFLYVQQTFTDSHYIYSMRRYIPVVLPAMTIFIAYALVTLKDVGGRWRPAGLAASVILGLGMVSFMAYTGRVIVPHQEWSGSVDQFSSLAARFEPGSVLLFSDGRDEPYVTATPMEYIFGYDVFVVRRDKPDNKTLDSVVSRWESQGRPVYVIMAANGGKLDLPGHDMKPVGEWRLDVPEFEQLYDQKPSNVYRVTVPLGIYQPVPRGQLPENNWPFSLDIGGADYKYLVDGFWEKEVKDGVSYRWTGRDGSGGTIRLPWKAGQSELRLSLSLSSGPPERGRAIPVKVSLDGNPIASLSVGPGFQSYEIDIPEGITPQKSDEVLLHLDTPGWSPRSQGISYDPRSLGIQIDSVEVLEGRP
ncbi:MAG: hypothetical protein M1358_02205 [Chloroflexi bacterium]|nr:hypothetical protein [Chloroflexota bacterium]